MGARMTVSGREAPLAPSRRKKKGAEAETGQERSPAEQPGASRFRLRIQLVDVNAQIGDNRPSCTVTKWARRD